MTNTTLEVFKRKLNKSAAKAYFVGGYVRDKLMGKESSDIDIEVFNITQDEIEKILNECADELSLKEVDLVGKSYGIYKIGDLDISLPRRERKLGNKHTDFDIQVVPQMSVEEASLRRDFTINSIYMDIYTLELLDFRSGVQDLKDGIIHHIDDKTFVEDPLRVFRAAQFASRFQFAIDEHTLELCKTIDLSELPIERILMETKKALTLSKHSYIYFEYLNTILGDDFKKYLGFKYDFKRTLELKGENYDFDTVKLFECEKSADKKFLTNKQYKLLETIQNCKSYKDYYLASFKLESIIEYLEYFGDDIKYEFNEKKAQVPTSEEIMLYCGIGQGKKLGLLIQYARELSFESCTKIEILEKLQEEL